MPLQPCPEVLTALASFGAIGSAFNAVAVGSAIRKAVPSPGSLPPERQRGWWAEFAAFDFSTHEAPAGGPWGTYFQPMMAATKPDGSPFYSPDLREADEEVIAYWATRARDTKHPVLAARYADLVWDTTRFVTKGKPDIELVRIAIDAYIAASAMDDGSAWGDTRPNLGRALRLAISVKDSERVQEAVDATFAYVDRTAEADKIGTFCYLFDHLLPPEKGPQLTEAQELKIVERFEAHFARMTQPGGKWDADPHGVQAVGNRLATYYQRKAKTEDRARVLRGVGAAFERRAGIGDPFTGTVFLEAAREIYLQAGFPQDAERVQRAAQEMAPAAQAALKPLVFRQEVSNKELQQFLDAMTTGTIEEALSRFAAHFVPDQQELARRNAERDKKFPLQAFFAPVLVGDEHTEADVGDAAGDPDGKAVFETSRHAHLHSPWIGWTLDRIIAKGLAVAQAVEFASKSPLFREDRLPLIRRGVEAHIVGDYAQAIHILLPQIERALVNLVFAAGKPSNKPHRTGRGVMQFKNLNDVLAREEWPVPGADGENLRVYLLAVLAHPKGMNIRNEVAHGLLSTAALDKPTSERVVHALLAVSLLRVTPTAP